MQCLVRLGLAAALCAFLPMTGWSQSLRKEADRSGMLIGAAVNPAYFSEPAYVTTLAREFNMLEPEDAMKWKVLRPNERTFNFGPADSIVEFAKLHGMKVRGHNLVWSTNNPKWLEDTHYTPKQLSDLLHDHINQVVGHYRGQVFAWDVVNEAFEEHGELRPSLWYNRPGIGAGKKTGYIEEAFRWAHAADPDALLFYNDAEAEEINRKSNAIYSMVKKFKRRGVPIDGIGLQMHVLHLNPDVASISANIARFTKLGVQVHITEMDIGLPVDSAGAVVDPSDLVRQAQLYREITNACLRNPGCTAVQTWGFTDKYSWIGWFTHKTKGDGLLFDQQYRPKPAYEAVEHALVHHSEVVAATKITGDRNQPAP
jgi:endo-1,4-beta-xylanase